MPPATSRANDLSPVDDYSAIAIVAMKKVVDPVLEARNDYDILGNTAQTIMAEAVIFAGTAPAVTVSIAPWA